MSYHYPSDLGLRFLSPTYLSSGKKKVVFRAFDRTESQWVALKIMRSSEIRTSLDEIEPALRKLKHPNIVRIIDFFPVIYEGDSVPCIVEELLDSTLEREVPITPKKLLFERLYDLGSGLAYLHSKASLVHRDLKPDNCGLKGGIVKLFDFGTVSSAGNPSLRYGFPSTRAPEILARSLKRRNPKLVYSMPQDVWALGVTAFYLATGEYPFLSIQEATDLGRAEDVLYRNEPGDKSEARERIGVLVDKAISQMKVWKPKNDKRIRNLPELIPILHSALRLEHGDRATSSEIAEMLRKIVCRFL